MGLNPVMSLHLANIALSVNNLIFSQFIANYRNDNIRVCILDIVTDVKNIITVLPLVSSHAVTQAN